MNIFNAITPNIMKNRNCKSDKQSTQPAVMRRAAILPVWSFAYLLFPTLLMAQADSLDIEYSPFDESIYEPLVLMASQLQENDQHFEAIEAMEKAWQVNRVSRGLYNESQIELIESMVVSEVELENWDAVSRHYNYLEHLYNRIYDIDDPKLEIGLQKLSSWYVNAFSSNLNGKRLEHLRKARRILKKRLEIAEHTLNEDHPKYGFLQESIAISEQHLYLASDIHKGAIHQSKVRDRFLSGIN